MAAIRDARRHPPVAVTGPAAPAELGKRLDALSAAALAGEWIGLQYVGLKETTEASAIAAHYFALLPHDQPERAFALVLAVLASEAHKSVKLYVKTAMMDTLVNAHGARLIDEIETEAVCNPRLRWLLGGAYWRTSNEAVRNRLRRIADPAAWEADDDTHGVPAAPLDYAAMSIEELAGAWVEQQSRPRKDQDDNWYALFEFESELRERAPDRALDLVVEILRIETNEHVLALLAAGMLEDLIGPRTIDRMETLALGDKAFARLLAGTWYNREPAEIRDRLDAAIASHDWEA